MRCQPVSASLNGTSRLNRGISKPGGKCQCAGERTSMGCFAPSIFLRSKADDKVSLNHRSWFPYVHPKGNDSLAWTFSTPVPAEDGALQDMLRTCTTPDSGPTASAITKTYRHRLRQMKNITPDINPEIFENFYAELYRLLDDDLKTWQCIMIDQTLSSRQPHSTTIWSAY